MSIYDILMQATDRIGGNVMIWREDEDSQEETEEESPVEE